MSVTVRQATESDIPRITEIYAHHVLQGVASFEEIPPTADDMLQRMRDITNRRLPYLVAEQGNIVLGYAYAAPYKLRSAYRFTVENSIYIDASHHRRGLGALLLKELISQCEALGLRQMLAVIGGGSEASVALHAAHGFQHAGRLQNIGYKFDRWLDIVLMTREIGDGAGSPPVG
jgi:L-amino acid N-acyltransferase YncA